MVRESKNLVGAFTKHGVKALWEEDSKFDVQNGLTKIIFVITEKNTIFGLDSKTGDVAWERDAPADYTVQKIFKVKKHHETKEALVYLTHNSKHRSMLLQYLHLFSFIIFPVLIL